MGLLLSPQVLSPQQAVAGAPATAPALVGDGESLAPIELPDDATPQPHKAATELADYVAFLEKLHQIDKNPPHALNVRFVERNLPRRLGMNIPVG